MDPLSIIASVIAVLQAANAVISVCYDFKAAMKDVPKTLTWIITEIQELRNVLETLDQLASDDLNASPGSSLKRRRSFELLSNPDTGPLAACLRELKSLETLIESRSGVNSRSRTKALVQVMKWQFGGEEIQLSLKRIDRIKSTLTLAITADEAALLLDIQDMTLSLTTTVESMSTKLTTIAQRVQDRHLNKTHRSILRWLSPVDPRVSHEAATKIHQEGTNNWFVQSEEFKSWYGSKRSFLWLSGFPGAGKTILFSSTVTHLREQMGDGREDNLMAIFYCDFRRKETQDLVNMVGSLVGQLCYQSGIFPIEVEEAFQQIHNTSGHQKPTLHLLRQILEDFASRSHVILLIDALDECLQRQDAAEFISDLQRTKSSLSILVTSRDEVEMQAGLYAFSHMRIEGHLAEVNVDVKSYINHRLSSDRRLQWLNDSVKDDIASLLIEKSAGMFRWVQCQIDAIANLRTVKAIRAALQELPKGLDETYDNILLKIPPSDTETVRRILMWVSFAVMPLTLKAVHEAIAIDPHLDHLDEESSLRTPQDMLDLCGSLIIASEEGYLGLAHLSVKEYLLSLRTKQNQAVSAYALEPDRANHELAENCLAYLSFREFSSGPCLTSESYTDRLIRMPLVNYAAVCWSYFVRATTMTPDLRDRITHFFQPLPSSTFMSWVQVLNAIHGSWDFYPKPTTTLYYASTFGLADTVEDLLRHPDVKSSLDAPGSRFGGTALHGAVLREHITVMRLLLEAGADPNKADLNKICPLHTAAEYGNRNVIEMLLGCGASLDALDHEGKTPYDWAVRAANPVSMRMLVRSTDFEIKLDPNTSHSPLRILDVHSDAESPEPADPNNESLLLMSRRGTLRLSSRISFLKQYKEA